ncbi:MAG: phosphodiester glycosidase family protein, partial [Sciscionella sp.]
APGTMSTTARIAEWARNNGLSPVVNWLEQQTYAPPKVGGAPGVNSPLRHPPQAGPPQPMVAMPASIPPPAQPALPGEGQWQVIARAHGKPAMAEAFLRPDAVHTSYTAAAVWFNPHLVRARLHPGTAQPGGTGWSVPSTITRPSGLLAAFNSGFKLADAHGGFYQHGRYAKALAPGGASMVFYRDGTMTVGQWGRDVHMSPQVAAVRQNLVLLVDHGRVVPGIDANTQQVWGATVGNKKYVWRSGIGVTATGGIVNVIGPRLSAHALAVLLRRAGCVRAMELDINQEWTSYVLYHHTGAPGSAGPHNLLSTMRRSPQRYNSLSARDFVTLHTRNHIP